MMHFEHFKQVDFSVSQKDQRGMLAWSCEEGSGYSPSESVDRYSLTRP